MQDILSQVHISDLVEQTDIQDNDVFPIDSTTDTLKVKASTLKQYIGGELASGKIDKTEKGAANGVATLDGSGLVPSSQLPSFVDDILEGTAQNPTQTPAGTYSADGFILTGEATPCVLEEGKTYVDTSSNIQYRWTGTGSNLVSMGSGLVLGETQYSAYAGNKGKANADAISALQIGKVDKVDGKGLSTEDFTTEEKQKLATLVVGENYAELSEAYAIGTRNGQPVTSGDVAYHNNSKYHADLAHESEIRSGSFANIAGLSAESAEQSEIRSGSFANVAGLSAENAVDNALKSEGFAVGKQNGTDVGSTSPYYHNNAEYYKKLAEEAAAQAGALDMTGATATTDGTHGLIKQPHAGDQDKFFRGDGAWADLPEFQGVNGSIASIGGILPPAPMDGEDLVFKGDGTWGQGGNDALIAPVEKSNTATNAYAVGEQFVLNGVLCKATAAISVGDTFVFDTNYQYAADISSQIKAIVDAYVTGIKGNAETDYRHGNVNITYPNIGTVPVANGGTGQTTLALARNAMGLGNTTEALPVANGGTGATKAANARSNLGLGGAATYGVGSVASGNTGLVTGGAVYTETHTEVLRYPNFGSVRKSKTTFNNTSFTNLYTANANCWALCHGYGNNSAAGSFRVNGNVVAMTFSTASTTDFIMLVPLRNGDVLSGKCGTGTGDYTIYNCR